MKRRSNECYLFDVVHSTRNAIIIPPFVVRRAGTKQASKATAMSSSAIAATIAGSVALTLKSRFFIVRVNANERNQAKHHADKCQLHALPDHQFQHVASGRAERHPLELRPPFAAMDHCPYPGGHVPLCVKSSFILRSQGVELSGSPSKFKLKPEFRTSALSPVSSAPHPIAILLCYGVSVVGGDRLN